MNVKELKKDKQELITEIFGVALDLKYSVDHLEQIRDEYREQAKDLTKTISKARAMLTKVEAKYKEHSGRDMRYK